MREEGREEGKKIRKRGRVPRGCTAVVSQGGGERRDAHGDGGIVLHA